MDMSFTTIKIQISSPEMALISQARSLGKFIHEYQFNPHKSMITFKTVNPSLVITDIERCLPQSIEGRICYPN
ncbi:MAG: hypothetical protein COA43_00495 [Robiginitomaculum sp.]|nr:MAG: hypothetical protein COA43_00495 [Robiginitomaculum sp.]